MLLEKMGVSALALALVAFRWPRARALVCMRAESASGLTGGGAARPPAAGLAPDGASAKRLVRKVRHHVNPLASAYAKPAALDAGWFAAEFADPTLPLTVDIGCAFGGWCLAAAALDAGGADAAARDAGGLDAGGAAGVARPSAAKRNFLGLEIRHPPVEVARARRDAAGLRNCAFLRLNANVDLGRVLADANAAGAPLERVLVQFPDPWFKKRHQKRRVITRELASTVAAALGAAAAAAPAPAPAPLLYVASDVLELAAHMRATFRATPGLVDALPPDAAEDADAPETWRWLDASPLELPTEREAAVLAGLGETSTRRGEVFRAAFRPAARRGDDDAPRP